MNTPTGIGMIYNIALNPYFDLHPDTLNYIELTPDILLQDKGPGQPGRFIQVAKEWEMIRSLAQRWPMVAHHIGFSLGSADYFDQEYLDNVLRLHEEFGFHWHSDHLSYSKLIQGETPEYNTCLALPVPYDNESLEMIAAKIRLIREAVGTPFFIENNVYFTEIPDEELTEPEFLKNLCRESGCGLLLDLHNVYVNSRNFGFNPYDFVDALDLGTVQEIHIAGGNEAAGIYLDSHSGPCPEEVWQLLDYVLPRCTQIRGITFEVDESYIPEVGFESVASQLNKARNIWNKHKTPQHVA
ncbi:DUF692 domain-containing protein [Taibaiella helva]|uniref:DUF692 domain-containing protein n=1 Tax=Taibaiella helva TaxID=2301235 RepID=UPI000E579D23|nr:DUF692 family multinuclear iron-containing protein [Taibaiella helva]